IPDGAHGELQTVPEEFLCLDGQQALTKPTLALFTLALLIGCTSRGKIQQFNGNIWGTTYHISYVSTDSPVPQDAIDDLLSDINQSLSTYVDTSVISRINASTDTTAWFPVDAHFENVFRRAREVYVDTGRAFNPAVGPLVNAWGFGPEGPSALPSDDEIHD